MGRMQTSDRPQWGLPTADGCVERGERGPGSSASGPLFSSSRGSCENRRFPLWHFWFPLGIFAGLVSLFETTDLDLRLSDIFFDFQKGSFFWKNTWWATSLIHSGGESVRGNHLELLAPSVAYLLLETRPFHPWPSKEGPGLSDAEHPVGTGYRGLHESADKQTISRAYQTLRRDFGIHQATPRPPRHQQTLQGLSCRPRCSRLQAHESLFRGEGDKTQTGSLGARFRNLPGNSVRIWSACEGLALRLPQRVVRRHLLVRGPRLVPLVGSPKIGPEEDPQRSLPRYRSVRAHVHTSFCLISGTVSLPMVYPSHVPLGLRTQPYRGNSDSPYACMGMNFSKRPCSLHRCLRIRVRRRPGGRSSGAFH